MRRELDLSLLSKYRIVLMGIAMLWIMLRHSPIDLTTVPFVIRFISRGVVGGVDMFFFLSGLGVYFSYTKSASIKDFYKKRVFRILPYVMPVTLLFALFFQYPNGEIPVSGIFTRFFLLDYWLECSALGWFIPVVLVFYLLTPFIIRLMAMDGFGWRTCLVIMLVCYLLGIAVYHLFSRPGIMNDFTHLGIYVLGIQVGYLIDQKKGVNLFGIVAAFVLGMVLYALQYRFWPDSYFLYMFFNVLPFVFLTLPLALLLSYLLSLVKGYKYPLLSLIGGYTLAIYALHERLLLVLNHCGVSNYILIGFLASLVLAYFWQNMISMIVGKIVK